MLRIPKHGTEVDAKRLSENTNANLAIAENTGLSGVSNSSSWLNITTAQKIKEKISFSALLAASGHHVEGDGERKRCLCPFHAEKTPSFTIYGDAWAKCYGCHWSGDVINYVRQAHGIGFKDALRKLQSFDTECLRTTASRFAGKKQERDDELNVAQKSVLAHIGDRLKSEEWLQGRVADARGWNRETIRSLAIEGSLGWYAGALAFAYTTGLKLRDWPTRRIIWDFGHGCLWRARRLVSAERVYVTEGETDAISLLDAGIENDPSVAVVSIPSATTFTSSWGTQFKGKTVTLCFDNDEAGEKALTRIVPAVAPYASHLLTLDWKEIS